MQPQYITLTRYAIDLTGQRFGKLLALGPIDHIQNGIYVWHCECECGNFAKVRGKNLRTGHTKSCGCSKVNFAQTIQKSHGLSNHPVYGIWRDMIQRCTNPKRKSYASYGGRGIRVCDEWQHSFESFYEHVTKLSDYGTDGYTLDRIDNNDNYKPGNLRWASKSEQGRNTRRTRMMAYNGKEQCLKDWAGDLGVNPSAIIKRLRAGWSAERALATPFRPFMNRRP